MKMRSIASLATAASAVAACAEAPTKSATPATESRPAIAFVSTRDGTPHVYVMNADGTHVRRLTSGTDVEWAPAWSPDGQRVAFNMGPTGDTYVVNVDGSGLRQLSASGGWPSWSPDGKQIVVAAWAPPTVERPLFPGLSLRLIALDGSGVTELPMPRMIGTDTVYWALRPRWSPDGDQILVEVSRMFNGDLETVESFLLMNADGTGSRLLLDGCSAEWSPDARRLALWAYFGFAPAVGVTSVDKIYPTPVLSDTDIEFTSCDGSSADIWQSGVWPSHVADWSPDGRFLIATRWTRIGKGLRLWLVDVQTRAAHTISTDSSQDFDAAWSRVP